MKKAIMIEKIQIEDEVYTLEKKIDNAPFEKFKIENDFLNNDIDIMEKKTKKISNCIII